jgi:hypothetical protein
VSLPGDDLVPAPAVVMDRTAVFDATPDQLWPWLVQLGKGRAGWYLPRRVERLLPARHRALRHVDPRWSLAVGDVVPDYGPDGSFTVEVLEPGRALVYASVRRRTTFSWALLVTEASPSRTRLHQRRRVSRAGRVMRVLGDQLDHATVAGLFAGLRERLAQG